MSEPPEAQTNGGRARQSASGRRRRRPADDSGDEEDSDGSRLASDPATEPPRAKRVHLSAGAGDDDDDGDAANETYYSTTSAPRRSGVNGLAGLAGLAGHDSTPPATTAFQPGAIVRVLVENFVTYERAEFSPGPSLNMVIGPNGTGKSSLVCAICLGLGFHSNVLGRASAFSDFVKHGRAHATVEIELQAGPADLHNHVVRLRISREDNSRKFWLDGQEAPLRRVQALMAALRIQVDNLCQFLPQDRVAEFAGLNPVDLLAKTLEAAAPVDMKDMQTTLRDLYRKQREAEQQTRVDAERLRSLEGRHQAQQADVERYHEREEIERTIADLEACRPHVRFQEAKAQYAALKRQRRVATRELQALQDRLGPTLQAINRKEAYRERLERGLEARAAVLQEAEQAVGRALAGCERLDSRHKDKDDEHKALSGDIDRKKKEIASTRQKITALEAKRKNKPQDFVAAEWNMKIREKEHQRQEIEAERNEIADEMNRIKIQGKRVSEDKQRVERDLAALDSRRGQQFSLLRRLAPDAAIAWRWLEDNKDKFSKEIFGPPMVTCAVKDQRYSNLVQSLLQNDDFLCFTTQSVEDHKKLSNEFYERMGLSVTIRTCTAAFDGFRPPVPADELAAMGFEGLAIDYLEGPAPVLAMLCAERRLHCSPVSIHKPRADQYERVVRHDSISTWAAQDQAYRISRRREYGAHAVSTSVRDIRPGRYWTAEAQAQAQANGDDQSETATLQRRLAALGEQLQALQEAMRALKERMAEPLRRDAALDADIGRLRAEKSQLQSEYNKWLALPEKIQAENNTLSRLREEHAALVGRRVDLAGALDALALQKARAALRHAAHVGVLRDAYVAWVDVQLRAVEAASDTESLRAQNADLAALLIAKQQTLAQVAEAMGVLKTEGEAALEAAGAVAAEGTARSDELHALARGLTLEGLDNEVAAEQAKLELTRAVDGGVLKEYRRRGREIEQLRAAMAAHAAAGADTGAQIAAVRGRWEPRLDALVGRISDAFSYNFEQISCAGEVGVRKDEADFERWAVEIRVRFREGEALQQLDQHRQSGGERAVSTIFYLMALQGMAQAPFRVVDEINQGMDPRNERMVHERMVEIACHEHASQYFLITPKLLPGLRYDENMTVLCIASGQHVPNNEAKLDFRRCMQIQRQLVAAA